MDGAGNASHRRALPPDIRGNIILHGLDAAEAGALEGKLYRDECKAGDILVQAGEQFTGLIFPDSLITSTVVEFRDGRQAEVFSTGREGVVGVPALLGLVVSDFRIVVRVGGAGFKLPLKHLEQLPTLAPGLSRSLMQAAGFQTFLIAQISACNRLHEVRERLARWYLLTDDRLQTGSFRVTHEDLAGLLGVRRSSVSVAANELFRMGAIKYRRGNVEIGDRFTLERAACDCYSELRTRLRLLIAASFEA